MASSKDIPRVEIPNASEKKSKKRKAREIEEPAQKKLKTETQAQSAVVPLPQLPQLPRLPQLPSAAGFASSGSVPSVAPRLAITSHKPLLPMSTAKSKVKAKEEKATKPKKTAGQNTIQSKTSAPKPTTNVSKAPSASNNGRSISWANTVYGSSQELLSSVWLVTKQLKQIKAANPHFTFTSGAFTSSEKAELKVIVERFRTANNLSLKDMISEVICRSDGQKSSYAAFWKEAAEVCPGRTLSSVYYKLKRMYDPGAHKGAWTKAEDDLLIKAVGLIGEKWVKVAKDVGRTEVDCKDRYINHLKPAQAARNAAKEDGPVDKKKQKKSEIIKGTGDWTAEEEWKLAKAVKKIMKKLEAGSAIPWKQVAQRVGTRSHKQCHLKWNSSLARQMRTGNSSISWRSQHTVALVQRLHASKSSIPLQGKIDFGSLADTHHIAFSADDLARQWSQLLKKIRSETELNNHQLIDQLYSLHEQSPPSVLPTLSEAFDPAKMTVPSLEEFKAQSTKNESKTKKGQQTIKKASPGKQVYKSREFVDSEDDA